MYIYTCIIHIYIYLCIYVYTHTYINTSIEISLSDSLTPSFCLQISERERSELERDLERERERGDREQKGQREATTRRETDRWTKGRGRIRGQECACTGCFLQAAQLDCRRANSTCPWDMTDPRRAGTSRRDRSRAQFRHTVSQPQRPWSARRPWQGAERASSSRRPIPPSFRQQTSPSRVPHSGVRTVAAEYANLGHRSILRCRSKLEGEEWGKDAPFSFFVGGNLRTFCIEYGSDFSSEASSRFSSFHTLREATSKIVFLRDHGKRRSKDAAKLCCATWCCAGRHFCDGHGNGCFPHPSRCIIGSRPRCVDVCLRVAACACWGVFNPGLHMCWCVHLGVHVCFLLEMR